MSLLSSIKKSLLSTESSNFPNDLEALWMPFSANKDFKKNPRLISKAKGMYYYTPAGDKILDGVAGLWCCNAGHNREPIVEAIKKQAEELDFAPAFNMGHPKSFELSSKLSQLAPEGFNHVFFGNSGSEAVESALKIALSYWKEMGKENKTILIGRNRGYHGTNFGGISVGGIEKNRNHKNYRNLKENLKILKNSKNTNGKKFKIIEIPMPKPLYVNNTKVPASYLNFYIANKIVLLPVFNDKNDKKVLLIFKKFFKSRKIIPIDCSELIWGFGAIHCMTQQEPSVSI